MTKSNLPKSVRAHIRLEKARIRKAVSDPAAQEVAVAELYKQFKIVYNNNIKS